MRNAGIFIFLLLLSAIDAGAQNTEITFTYIVDEYPESRIIESLLNGHRSEIRYEFRLLRKAKGLGKILGDRLVKKAETAYIARWHALSENFVVLIDGVTEHFFSDAASFLQFFFSVEYTMQLSNSLRDEDYLLCRSRIQPIKLVPPLTLMTLIKSDLQTISSWQQTIIAKVSP